MKTFTIPLVLWISAIAGLLLQLLADGALETSGLALLSVPVVLVIRYSVSALRSN